MSEHEHEWAKVPVVVTVINDPLAGAKGGETYNAECGGCGARAWLHWPSGSLAAAKVQRA